MSHLATQRVIVRMLFDPAFAQAVYQDAEKTLEREDLTREEMSWLTQPDPRAYRVDPFRQSRSLHALLEEFPCSGALISMEAEISSLLPFFSSPLFHGCIQNRGSLATTFGDYLLSRRHADPRIQPTIELEQAIVALRRQSQAPVVTPSPGQVMLASGKTVISLPQGTLMLRSAVWTALMEENPDPVAALIGGPLSPEGLPDLDERNKELLLLEIGEGENIHIEVLSDALFELLHMTRQPIGQQELIEKIEAMGMPRAEAEEVLQDISGDGLLEQG